MPVRSAPGQLPKPRRQIPKPSWLHFGGNAPSDTKSS
ncbi:hypothetical protein AK812_SmicGene46383, partial [Symbiodinium microadriaticum]